MKIHVLAKKSHRTKFKSKIKSAKSISDLKKAQVLFYYATFKAIDITFLCELTSLSKNQIENIVKAEYKLEKIRPAISANDIYLIKLICKGFTNKEIGNKLKRSFRGVESSREILMLKIGAKNTAGIVMYAVKNNIIVI